MKMNSKLKVSMKVAAILAFLTVLSSCAEEGVEPITTVQEETVESDEIAEIVAGSLAKDAQGFSAQLEASAKEASEADFDGDTTARSAVAAGCGQEYTDQFNLQSPDSLSFDYNYSFQYTYAFECNDFMVPSKMEFSLTQSGEVEGPRYGSNSSSSGDWVLSGLEISSTEYSFEGNYDRSGVHSSKVGEQVSVDFDLSLAIADVLMNKGNYVISQGKGSFSIKGNSTSGGSFAASGSLEYLGNHEVLLTINEDTYLIDLKTGEITPA